MTKDILKQFYEVRIEDLDDNARKLFDTIMQEFDKRDNYKQALIEIRNYCRSKEWSKDYENSFCRTHILQIIDKALGDDEK